MTTRDLLTLAVNNGELEANPAPGAGSLDHTADAINFTTDTELAGYVVEVEVAAGARGTLLEHGDLTLECDDTTATVRAGGRSATASRQPGSTLALAVFDATAYLAVDGYAFALADESGQPLVTDRGESSTFRLLPVFDGALGRARLTALTAPPTAADFDYAHTTLARQLFDETFDGDDAVFHGPDAQLEIDCGDLSDNLIVEATLELLPSRTAQFTLIDIAGAGSLEYHGGELHLFAGETRSEHVVDWTAESIPPYHPGRVYQLALHARRADDQQTLELYVQGMPCGSVVTPRPPTPHEPLVTLGGTRYAEPLAREFQFACERIRAVTYAWSPRDDLFTLHHIYRPSTLLDEPQPDGAGRDHDVPAAVGGITAPLLAEIEIDNALLNTPGAELLNLGGGISVRTPQAGSLELLLRASDTVESGDESRIFDYALRGDEGSTRVSLYAMHSHVLSVRVALDGSELASVVTNLPVAYHDQSVHFAPGQGSGVRACYLSAGGNLTSRPLPN
ncbi:hypothetical protein JT358_16275 [Micrococcales bacterium 31B]|nr:hypothetical protein [Micrococcales bacterium 31B]